MRIEALVYRISFGVFPNLKIPNVAEDLYIWTEECKVYCFASKKGKNKKEKASRRGSTRMGPDDERSLSVSRTRAILACHCAGRYLPIFKKRRKHIKISG